MSVSFAKDIKPLFRSMDVDHMSPFDIFLDDYAYMSDASNDHANAKGVFETLKDQSMPPGGPFWPQDKLDLFSQWMADGFLP